MKTITGILLTLVCSVFLAVGAEITPAVQAKIDAQVKTFQGWGKDAKFVNAVKAYNSSPSAEAKAMTNDKWKKLNMLDPMVRSLIKNDLGQHLKSIKTDAISEAFVSGADGGKVALLAKTSSWTHKGKAKHEEPMAGKTWQGKLEMDESTGKQQVQVSVPILDGSTPIGSLVIGLSIDKL